MRRVDGGTHHQVARGVRVGAPGCVAVQGRADRQRRRRRRQHRALRHLVPFMSDVSRHDGRPEPTEYVVRADATSRQSIWSCCCLQSSTRRSRKGERGESSRVRRPAASGGFGAHLRTLTVLLDCAPSMSSTRIVSRQALDGLRNKKKRANHAHAFRPANGLCCRLRRACSAWTLACLKTHRALDTPIGNAAVEVRPTKTSLLLSCLEYRPARTEQMAHG
jgi:hypothetical protein